MSKQVFDKIHAGLQEALEYARSEPLPTRIIQITEHQYEVMREATEWRAICFQELSREQYNRSRIFGTTGSAISAAEASSEARIYLFALIGDGGEE